MNPLIPNIFPNIDHSDLHLISRHAVSARHKCHTHRGQPIQKISHAPHAKCFLLLAFGPGIVRPFELAFGYSFEACVAHEGCVFSGAVPVAADPCGAVAEFFIPLKGLVGDVGDTGDGVQELKC
jgi:hypothetical protein